MKKKSCTLSLFMVSFFIIGILLLTGCAKTLSEAQIIVYEDGEKNILDSDSPYYKKLQIACEELLISAESIFYDSELINDFPKPEKVKNEETAIELVYSKSMEVPILLGGGPTLTLQIPIQITHCLIPLTGRWSQTEAVGISIESSEEGKQDYVCLFLSPEIVLNGQKWEGIIGANKDTQKIKEILTEFDITVP
jgi:hypothetical protein